MSVFSCQFRRPQSHGPMNERDRSSRRDGGGGDSRGSFELPIPGFTSPRSMKSSFPFVSIHVVTDATNTKVTSVVSSRCTSLSGIMRPPRSRCTSLTRHYAAAEIAGRHKCRRYAPTEIAGRHKCRPYAPKPRSAGVVMCPTFTSATSPGPHTSCPCVYEYFSVFGSGRRRPRSAWQLRPGGPFTCGGSGPALDQAATG